MFQASGKPISRTQAIKLSKIVNTSTAIVRREATFSDMNQNMLGYVQAFEEYRSLWFVDVRIVYIVEDMMSSKLLFGSSKAAFMRNIGVGKKIIKQQEISSLFLKLGKYALAERILGIAHLNDASLYISSKEDILLII